jgi:hypothetical protein
MPVAIKPAVEKFSFDGEVVSAVGAAALRRVKSLAEAAPQGRLFAAISSLSDNAGAAAADFEAASLATLRKETEAADIHLARGKRRLQRLKEAIGGDLVTPLPAFMRAR